jgi:two-component system nitrogen regulation sensor histidine kinase NtrY
MERLIKATSIGVIIPDLYAGVTTLSLRIIDTGKGFSPEARTRIFRPFYGAKRDGQGVRLTMIRETLVNHSLAINPELPRPG